MKSSEEQLKSRGVASSEDIDNLNGKSQKELRELLHSSRPVIRTAAAYNICINKDNEDEIATELLKQLSLEKCLYTKIAICECLEKGSRITAEHMIQYLGKIGSNQYKKLLDSVSKKKSYPLPRDIVARSLAKMPVEIFPVLLEVLKSNDEEKISEVIDAIGFMTFYNSQLCNEENAQAIYEVMEKYKDNLLIIWKCIICLSAFPFQKSRDILKKFRGEDSILGREADRSLNILNKR